MLFYGFDIMITYFLLQAFKQTWSAVCGDLSTPTFLVPAGMTFLLSKVSFSGPCNSPILVQVPYVHVLSK